MNTPFSPVIEAHFSGKDDAVRATYVALLTAARRFGPVEEDAKKTSIHLNRKTAFLGVATRKSAVILTVKADSPWTDPRVFKSEQTSAKRWHHEVKLLKPEDIDPELLLWIGRAYDLSA